MILIGMHIRSHPIATIMFITLPAAAERIPNPLSFIAGVDALHELCGHRYPNMASDAKVLAAKLSADDTEMIRLLRTSSEDPRALQKARTEVQKFSAGKVENECSAMHEDASRKPAPGRF